ncbi:MAG: type II toxin-antitoxin system Phd/YefM family antitoxin [Candidatus Margulisbacteria bacterium]|nr:type II toxin-antitoxin system Phd/YefM family antitoxin [Candidatus Margulisiibacteriota bacterium]
MPQIRPVSDLRNHFAEISETVHKNGLPLFLTKNGHGDMVVMSMDTYENKFFAAEIYLKLKEAEIEAKSSKKRLSHAEVFSALRQKLTQLKNV